MRPLNFSIRSRAALCAASTALALSALILPANADPLPAGAGRTFLVDCGLGDKISPKLTAARTAITVRGTCTENLLIQFDDISIVTDGVTPATIIPANAAQPTILLEGARRILIDGKAAGLTVNGGLYGIAATRGAALDVRNCRVTNTALNGFLASYSGSIVIDNCTITANAGNGAVAANTSSLVITNSVVSSNTLAGLLAVRSSFLRVGQDANGTVAVKPVTVTGNGTNGVSITESSAGSVVGGTIQSSGSTNLFIGRGSSGQIGLGSNGLTGGVTIQNSARDGIFIEGANATIAFSTIVNNAQRGIGVSNAGSARIGILNDSSAYAGNTISGNGANGIQVSNGSSAAIGGTTITGNGTAATVFGRSGVFVFQATADVVGNNAITNNGESGVFALASHVTVGDPGFGLPIGNTISGNGGIGPNNGGIFAFQGSVIRVNSATINNNVGPAVQAFENGVVELLGTTAVTALGSGGTAGALVQFGSTLRVRDGASIVSATGDGIQASNLTAVNIRDGNTVSGAGFGVLCFTTGPSAASAATLSGNLAGVTGGTGSDVGCNLFP
jgi:Right handed beta helix region